MKAVAIKLYTNLFEGNIRFSGFSLFPFSSCLFFFLVLFYLFTLAYERLQVLGVCIWAVRRQNIYPLCSSVSICMSVCRCVCVSVCTSVNFYLVLMKIYEHFKNYDDIVVVVVPVLVVYHMQPLCFAHHPDF